MLDSAVDDMGAVNAVADSLYTAVDFGNHTALNNAVALEHGNFADVYHGDERIFIVNIPEKSADVGH